MAVRGFPRDFLRRGGGAGPIDGPARPAPEVEGASAPPTEGTGADAAGGLSEAPRAPDPGAKPRAGNPLWTVPLSALSATRDRPLFSASRRPPIVAVPIVAPPPKQEVLAPPPPERPLLTLIGTIVSPKASVAMLQGSDAEAVSPTPDWARERRLAGARNQLPLDRRRKGCPVRRVKLAQTHRDAGGIVLAEHSRGWRASVAAAPAVAPGTEPIQHTAKRERRSHPSKNFVCCERPQYPPSKSSVGASRAVLAPSCRAKLARAPI